MNCTDFEKLFALDVEGDLPGPQLGKLREHLQACTRCHEFVQELNASQALLRGLAEEAVDEDALEEIRRRVRIGLAAEAERPAFLAWRWALGTGMVAALILGGLILRPLIRKPVPQAKATRRAPATVATAETASTLPSPLLPQTGKRISARQHELSSPASLRIGARAQHAESLTIKLLTDNPNLVIYWLVD